MGVWEGTEMHAGCIIGNPEKKEVAFNIMI